MKRFIVLAIVIGVATILLSWAATLENETVYVFPEAEAEKTGKKVELVKELIPICACESAQGTGKPQQYNVITGEVLRGVINPNDIGMCQISLTWHKEEAEKMGTLEDILEESRYKKDTSGRWFSTKTCCK